MKKLPFKIGFEMTGIPEGHKEKNAPNGWGNVLYGLSLLVSIEINKRFPKFKISELYRDGHCLEFQSPVFDEMNKLKEFYQTTFAAMKRYGINPQHRKTVCGGNHLHFDVTRNIGTAILRSMVNHPEIVWAFTQPDDTESCNNLTMTPTIRHVMRKSAVTFSEENSPWRWDRHVYNAFKALFTLGDVSPCDLETKADAVGFNNEGKSIEFRCVEAPKNWSEFKDQLDFFMAFTQSVAANPDSIAPLQTLPTKKALQAISRQNATRNFNLLLDKLGLKRSRYAKYVKRNLRPRWELNRKRN